jgi:hypothetical protein
METQNITLSLRKDLLRKARILAVERQTSLSGLLSRYIEQIVESDTAYDLARRRQMEWLEQGFDLGSAGMMPVSREALHER